MARAVSSVRAPMIALTICLVASAALASPRPAAPPAGRAASPEPVASRSSWRGVCADGADTPSRAAACPTEHRRTAPAREARPILASAAAAPAPAGPVGHRFVGQARGLTGPVRLRLADGTTQVVAADGAFSLTGKLAPGAPFAIEVMSAPADRDCAVTPARGTVSARDTTVTLVCKEAALAARPLLPADRAASVSPLLGRVVLVLTRPMREPPAGTFLLETRDGDEWVDTGLEAHAQYRPEAREWSFELAAGLLPASSSLRATVTPTAGTDTHGERLARKPIRWTFVTGKNPLVGKKPGALPGGCPVETQGREKAVKPKPPGEPCDEP